MHRAIAAAFAYAGIDERARIRIGRQPPLAPTPQFGGAILIVDDRRHTRRIAHPALDRVHLVAVVDGRTRSEICVGRIGIGLVRDDGNCRDTFRVDLPAQRIDPHLARYFLPARHRDRIVGEDLVGDVDPGCDRRSNGEQARVIVGPVPQVLEDMIGAGEGRNADPGRAFAAHLEQGRRVPLGQEGGHPVATDTAEGDTAIGHFGRPVVRAACTEARHSGQCGRRQSRRRAFRLQTIQRRAEAVISGQSDESRSDRPRRDERGRLADRRDQRRPVRACLASQQRRICAVDEQAGDLVLDHRAFFLDHQDFPMTLGKLAKRFRLQRPGHRHLEHRDTQFPAPRSIQAEVLERLHDVEIGLAAGHDAQRAGWRRNRLSIEPVDPDIFEQGGNALIVLAIFRFEGRDAPTRGQSLAIPVGNGDRWPVRVDIDRCAAFDDIGNAFHPDPAARMARHGEAVQAEIEIILHR